MKAFRQWVSDRWRALVAIIICSLLITALFTIRLHSLTPAASSSEFNAAQSTQDYHQLINNPAFTPHRVVSFGLHILHGDNLFTLRLVSALFATAIIMSFYLLVKFWTSSYIGALCTVLLATSAWFLHYGRLATPDILYGTLIIVIALGVSLEHSPWRKITLFALICSSALALYIPGLIWFMVAGLIWRSKLLLKELKKIPRGIAVAYAVLFLALLLPLGLAIAKNFSLGQLFLGLPATYPNLLELLRRFGNIPVQIFLRGPANPTLWLGRLPLLDIFTAIMTVSGLYVVIRKWQFDRSKLLLGALLLSTVLIALGGAVQMSILIPLIYSLAAIGIAYMIEEWLSVFPRNPLARNIGMALMLIAVGASCFYNLQHYFVAWPNAPATKAVYTNKLP